jgi:hypothetical protein
MIQLTRLGTTFSGTEEELERLRLQFTEQHCIRLPRLVDPPLLRILQEQIAQAEFYERVHQDGGVPPPVDLCMRHNVASLALHFLVNDRTFLQFVERVTGSGHLGRFQGSVYRLTPGLNHYDSWHSDVVDDRMLAMSINLSTDVYRGGILEICDWGSRQVVHQVANTGFGDGTIFRIADHLKHRVSPVEGTVPRTAFAGWFFPRPDYQTWLKKSLAEIAR